MARCRVAVSSTPHEAVDRTSDRFIFLVVEQGFQRGLASPRVSNDVAKSY